MFSTANPEACQALVLNADFRPLSYYPLSLWHWQDAVKAVFLDRVAVVAEYDTVIHSPTTEFRLPSVIALKDYVQQQRQPAFTRFNVFLRDRFSCQYCGQRFTTQELTFDHVLPRMRGGRTTWENVVTACQACNLRKGSKELKSSGLNLLNKPHQPATHELQNAGRAFPPPFVHTTWRDYLYWDSELEA